MYLYAADDDRVLSEEYVYCDNFKKKHNDYLLSAEYKDHPLSQKEYYEKCYDEPCYSDNNKSIDASSLVDYALEQKGVDYGH